MPPELLAKVLRGAELQPGLRDHRVPRSGAARPGVVSDQGPGRRRTADGCRPSSRRRSSDSGLDYPPVPPRYHSGYFSHIFESGYSAGYYAYLWSEVLARDTGEWFSAHGGLTRANGDILRAGAIARPQRRSRRCCSATSTARARDRAAARVPRARRRRLGAPAATASRRVRSIAAMRCRKHSSSGSASPSSRALSRRSRGFRSPRAAGRPRRPAAPTCGVRGAVPVLLRRSAVTMATASPSVPAQSWPCGSIGRSLRVMPSACASRPISRTSRVSSSAESGIGEGTSRSRRAWSRPAP